MADEALQILLEYANNEASLNRARAQLDNKLSSISPTINTKNINSQLNSLGASFSKNTGAVKDFSSVYQKEIDKTVSHQRRLNDVVTKGGAAFDNFAQRVGFSANRLTAYIVPASLFFNAFRAVDFAVGGVNDLNRSLVRLDQVLGGSAVNARDVSKEILAIAANLGQSGRQIQELALTVAQADIAKTAEDFAKITDALARSSLSPTFGNIQETFEGGLAYIKQFNTDVSSLNGTLDTANELSKRFAVEASDLFTAVQTGGAAFAAFDGSIENFQAVVTTLRSLTRLSASTIGTGINTISQRLFRRENLDLLSAKGVSVTDETGQLRSFTELIREVAEVYKDLDSTQKPGLIEALFGIRQGKLGIALLEDLSKGTDSLFQQTLDVANNAKGSVFLDSIQGLNRIDVQLQRISSTIEQTLGEIAGDKNLINFIQNLTDGITQLISLSSTALPVLTQLLKIGGLAATYAAARAIPSVATGLGFSGIGRFSTVRNAVSGRSASTASKGGMAVSQEDDLFGGSYVPNPFAPNTRIVPARNRERFSVPPIDNRITKREAYRLKINANLNEKENLLGQAVSARKSNQQALDDFRFLQNIVDDTNSKSDTLARSSVDLRRVKKQDKKALGFLYSQRSSSRKEIKNLDSAIKSAVENADLAIGKSLRKDLEYFKLQSKITLGLKGQDLGRSLLGSLPENVRQGLDTKSFNRLSNSGVIPSAASLALAPQNALVTQREIANQRLGSIDQAIVDQKNKFLTTQDLLHENKQLSNETALKRARASQAIKNLPELLDPKNLAEQEALAKKEYAAAEKIINTRKNRIARLEQLGKRNRNSLTKSYYAALDGLSSIGIGSGSSSFVGPTFGNAFGERAKRDQREKFQRRAERAKAARLGGLFAAGSLVRGEDFNSFLFGEQQNIRTVDDDGTVKFNQRELDRQRRQTIGSSVITNTIDYAITGAMLGKGLGVPGAVVGAGIGLLSGRQSAKRLENNELSSAIAQSSNLGQQGRLFNERFSSQLADTNGRADSRYGKGFLGNYAELARESTILGGFFDVADSVFGKNSRTSGQRATSREELNNSQEFSFLQDTLLKNNKDIIDRVVKSGDLATYAGDNPVDRALSDLKNARGKDSIVGSLYKEIFEADIPEDTKRILRESVNGLFDQIAENFNNSLKDFQKGLEGIDLTIERTTMNMVKNADRLSLSNTFASRNLQLASGSYQEGSFVDNFSQNEEIRRNSLRDVLSGGNIADTIFRNVPGIDALQKSVQSINNIGNIDERIAEVAAIRERDPEAISSQSSFLASQISGLSEKDRDRVRAALESGQIKNTEQLRKFVIESGEAFQAALAQASQFAIQSQLEAQKRNAILGVRGNISGLQNDLASSQFSIGQRADDRRRSLIFSNNQDLITTGLGIDVGSQDTALARNLSSQLSIRDRINQLQIGGVSETDRAKPAQARDAELNSLFEQLAQNGKEGLDVQRRLNESSVLLSKAFDEATRRFNASVADIQGRGRLSYADAQRASFDVGLFTRSAAFKDISSIGSLEELLKLDPSKLQELSAGLQNDVTFNRVTDSLRAVSGESTVAGSKATGNEIAQFLEVLRGLGVGATGVNRENVTANRDSLRGRLKQQQDLSDKQQKVDESLLRFIQNDIDVQNRILEFLQRTDTGLQAALEVLNNPGGDSSFNDQMKTLNESINSLTEKIAENKPSRTDISIAGKVDVSGLDNKDPRVTAAIVATISEFANALPSDAVYTEIRNAADRAKRTFEGAVA